MPLRRFLLSSWAPMLGTAVAIIVILLRDDVAALAIVVFGAYLAVAVALPGVFVWRLLLRRYHSDDTTPPTWFEDLSLGTIVGFGIQLPVYLLGVWVGLPLLFLVLPVAVVVVTAATGFGRSVWTMPTGRLDVRAAWSLGAVVVYGLAWFATTTFSLRPLTLPLNQTPSVDETFHLALISDLMNRFPPQIPFLLGTPLDYHWFVHAQIATSEWVTQLDSTVMIRALMPATELTLTVLGLGAVALRLTGRPVAAVVAPALLVAGGFNLIGPHYASWLFSEAFMSKRFVSSPSQAYGFMMALPAIMMILEVLRPDRKPSRLTWVALTIALFSLSGAKATFMPIFLCGAIAVWVIHLLVHRTIDWTASALVGLLAVVTVFAQVVLFGGQSGALSLEPFNTVQTAVHSQGIPDSVAAEVAMTVTLLLGWLLYGVGAFGLRAQARWRDPRALWMFFAIPVGVAVALMFFRSGLSQMWFQRSVAELVVLLSAWGLSSLLPNPLTKQVALAMSGMAAAAGLGAFVIASFLEAGRRNELVATFDTLVYTAIAPFVIVTAFFVVRAVLARVGASRPRLGPVILLALLLGLGSSHVYSLGYDTLTQRPGPHLTPHNLFSPGGIEAARYIARHGSADDVVATNVHCLKPDARRCDNRNFWVSAYTERRIVVEGWGYTAGTNEDSIAGARSAFVPIPDKLRLAINDAAFKHPSPQTVGRLVDTYDVTWLFVSKKYSADARGLNGLTNILAKKFHNRHYAVFKVLK